MFYLYYENKFESYFDHIKTDIYISSFQVLKQTSKILYFDYKQYRDDIALFFNKRKDIPVVFNYNVSLIKVSIKQNKYLLNYNRIYSVGYINKCGCFILFDNGIIEFVDVKFNKIIENLILIRRIKEFILMNFNNCNRVYLK